MKKHNSAISLGKRRNLLVAVSFFCGIGITLGIVSLVLIIQRMTKSNQVNSIPDQIVAPYYERSQFKQTLDLQGIHGTSSESSTMQNNVSLRLPIVLYHYVEYVADDKDLIRKRLDITPDMFERQLKVLQENHFQTYFVRDIPELLGGKMELNSKSIMLTFDDGYEDFYTSVLPLLKKYNMKATAYIVYNFIGRKGYLTSKQVQEIIASGLVEIGAHTLDHLYLKLVPESIARKQIFESKRKLEETYGIQVNTFAYPYGAMSQDTVNLVKEASYSAAVSVIAGVTHTNNTIFYLSRIRAGVLTGRDMVKTLDSIKK